MKNNKKTNKQTNKKLRHWSLIPQTQQTFHSQLKPVKIMFSFQDQPGIKVCVFDDKLSMKHEVGKICQSAYLEQCRISSIGHALTVYAPNTLCYSWYCHALIAVTPCCQGFLNVD